LCVRACAEAREGYGESEECSPGRDGFAKEIHMVAI
jgi:hypothetical protein